MTGSLQYRSPTYVIADLSTPLKNKFSSQGWSEVPKFVAHALRFSLEYCPFFCYLFIIWFRNIQVPINFKWCDSRIVDTTDRVIYSYRETAIIQFLLPKLQNLCSHFLLSNEDISTLLLEIFTEFLQTEDNIKSF